MGNTEIVIIIMILGIIFLFSLFLSSLERFKKLFNILSWVTGIALLLLAAYYFIMRK